MDTIQTQFGLTGCVRFAQEQLSISADGQLVYSLRVVVMMSSGLVADSWVVSDQVHRMWIQTQVGLSGCVGLARLANFADADTLSQ